MHSNPVYKDTTGMTNRMPKHVDDFYVINNTYLFHQIVVLDIRCIPIQFIKTQRGWRTVWLGYNISWQKERKLTKEKMLRPTVMTTEHAWHGLCPAVEVHKPFRLFSKTNSSYPDSLCISGWLVVPVDPDKWSSTVKADHSLGYFRPWERLITTDEITNQFSDPL